MSLTLENPEENRNGGAFDFKAKGLGDSSRAIVLHPFSKAVRDDGARSPGGRLSEAVRLAESIGLAVVEALAVGIRKPLPATLLGTGQVKEAGERIKALAAEVVIVDSALTPIQQRNLEKEWKVKVVDRTGLILEIFGERARTREGALQVELAHLEYQKTRLVRAWTHLERQRGGFGFLGGAGETQIEADRRMIRERIAKLRQQLDKVVKTRALHRKGRKKVPYPVVALAGYTNAGKSTLFNRLTRAGVLAADQLFATLDPAMRGLALPSGKRVILSDTVGFISDLPTQLVAAFRATLEELIEADVILHVRDSAEPEGEAQCADVLAVLKSLGIEADDPRIVEVFNKIDRLPWEEHREMADRLAQDRNRAAVSALDGEGTDNLLGKIDERLSKTAEPATFRLGYDEGDLLAWLHQHARIIERRDDAEGMFLRVRITEDEKKRFQGIRARLAGGRRGS